MRRNETATLTQHEETKEEIIGILTAISVVSKRLAKKLDQLENPYSEKGVKHNGQSKTAYSHAD